eukprot:m.1638346 g.1638346  ORF g.1638346 m.1638346 type:complete len:327 (-) comp27647_c0_seq1:89-1069(-)
MSGRLNGAGRGRGRRSAASGANVNRGRGSAVGGQGGRGGAKSARGVVVQSNMGKKQANPVSKGVISSTRQALQATTSKVPLSDRFAQIRGGVSARSRQASQNVPKKQQRGQRAQKTVATSKPTTRTAQLDVRRVQKQMEAMSKQIAELRQQARAINADNGNTGGRKSRDRGGGAIAKANKGNASQQKEKAYNTRASKGRGNGNNKAVKTAGNTNNTTGKKKKAKVEARGNAALTAAGVKDGGKGKAAKKNSGAKAQPASNKKKSAKSAAGPKAGAAHVKKTPEDLDADMDRYFAETPKGLDTQLDEYMAARVSKKTDDPVMTTDDA